MKNKRIKLVTGTAICLAILGVGTYVMNVNANNALPQKPLIFTEVAHADTLYDYSNSKVLAERADLIVTGKITNLGAATNYNPMQKTYGRARTPGTLEVEEVLKGNVQTETLSFMDIGGTIRYTDYEKSLLPAQKAKRDYLMQKNGDMARKSTALVEQSVKNQLNLETGKTYILYLKYDEDFNKYVVFNQPYGVKEYNLETKEVKNHVTNTVEKLSEMM